MRQKRHSTKMYVVHHNTLSDSFQVRMIWFQPKQDSDRIRISFFKNRIGSHGKLHYPIISATLRLMSTPEFLNVGGIAPLGAILMKKGAKNSTRVALRKMVTRLESRFSQNDSTPHESQSMTRDSSQTHFYKISEFLMDKLRLFCTQRNEHFLLQWW